MSTKTCVITGGSRGIGLATALRFARSGYNLVVAGRDAGTLEQAAEKIRTQGAICEPVVADVGRQEDAIRFIAEATRRFTRVDVLVNNAGYATMKPVDEIDQNEFAQTLAVNVHAVFHTTQAAWPIMKQHGGGTIVNVSSVASVDPFPGFSIYGASKAWVNIFTQAIAQEGKAFGIRAFCIAPGAVETQMLRGLLPDFPEGETISPDAVAAAIEMCSTEAMAHSTGQTIFTRK